MAILFPGAIARPTCSTPAVRDKAIDKLLQYVLEWLDDATAYADSERERIRGQLADALDSEGGYTAATVLERKYYWSPDSELVEILEGFEGDLYDAQRAAVQQWVKETEPSPARAVGDSVKAKWGGNIIEGVITKIEKDTAQFVVRRETDAENAGAVVNWEDVQ